MKLYISGDATNITYDFFKNSILDAIKQDYEQGHVWSPKSIITTNRNNYLEYYSKLFSAEKCIPLVTFVEQWFQKQPVNNYSYYRSLDYNMIDKCDVIFYFSEYQLSAGISNNILYICDTLLKPVYIIRKQENESN